MQIVYLSNRPNLLLDTLRSVERYMPFITEAVVICPNNVVQQLEGKTRISLKLIPDESLKKDTDDVRWSNKSYQNYHLRKRMSEVPEIEDEFIMSDDDYRPLRKIDLDFFKEEGRYHPYYFYDLKFWQGKSTNYDACVANARLVLNYFGYDSLGFSSHQPQIINKSIYNEAVSFFEKANWDEPLCEWTIYFNYAIKTFPEKFHKSKGHHVMCWPPLPGLWAEYVIPSTYYFENYYPEHYTQGGLFEQLESNVEEQLQDANTLSKLSLIEKVRSREIYPPPLGHWRSKSLIQRWKNAIMRKLFTIREELNIDKKRRSMQLDKKNTLEKWNQ